MGVKGTKAMYELAKAKAIDNGIREIYTLNSDESLICGYALMQDEIKQIFFVEGFTREKTIENYLKIWTSCGLTIPARNGSYFFVVDDDELINLRKKQLRSEGITNRIYAEVSA